MSITINKETGEMMTKFSNESTKPKISIIVPVYNMVAYLSCCLDSLINQTLRDIEIICIDDKSTDDSLSILQAYAQKDERIKLIALDVNSGAATATNYGLAIATGEYIGFVDPDDYIELDFYNLLYAKAMESGADIAKGNVMMVDEATGHAKLWGPDFAKMEENKYYFYYTRWSAIYRHDMLQKHSIIFEKELMVEYDILFQLQAVTVANKVALEPKVYYFYRWRADSLDSNFINAIKVKSRIKACQLIAKFINTNLHDDTSYTIAYGIWLDWIISMSYRCLSLEDSLAVINASIELYHQYKLLDKPICENDTGLTSRVIELLKQKNALLLFHELAPTAINNKQLEQRIYTLEMHMKHSTLLKRLFGVYRINDKKYINILGFQFSFKRKHRK